MPYYANIFDLADLPEVTRALVSDFIEPDPTVLDPDTIGETYVPVVGEDTEQIEARVAILRSRMGVTVEERSE